MQSFSIDIIFHLPLTKVNKHILENKFFLFQTISLIFHRGRRLAGPLKLANSQPITTGKFPTLIACYRERDLRPLERMLTVM